MGFCHFGFNFGFNSRQPAAAPAAAAAWSTTVSATARTMFLAVDDATRVEESSGVTKWKDVSDTDFDFSYVSGTKCTYDTTYPVNTSQKTIQNNGAAVLMQAAAAGKSSKLWPSGVGSLYMVVYITTDMFAVGATSDAGNSVLRHGGAGSYGGVVSFYKDDAGSPANFDVRATVYDGATKAANDVDIPQSGNVPGWHLISIRNTGSAIKLQVDDRTEISVASGAMSYLDGVLQIFNAYNALPTTALALVAAYSTAHDDTARDARKAEIRSCIADV